VRHVIIIFRYHGPDSDDAGTVCAIDAPSVVPCGVRGADRRADRQRTRGGGRDESAGFEDVDLARARVVGGDEAVLKRVPHADRRGGGVGGQRIGDSGLEVAVILKVLAPA
jgi:hypothetical protein